jgi:hypothetical protein
VENNTTAQTESRRLARRLDNWTLYAFNPTFPRNGTALSEAIARQEAAHRENRSTTSMTDSIRRVLRRLDAWTLTVFNPYYASDHRR